MCPYRLAKYVKHVLYSHVTPSFWRWSIFFLNPQLNELLNFITKQALVQETYFLCPIQKQRKNIHIWRLKQLFHTDISHNAKSAKPCVTYLLQITATAVQISILFNINNFKQQHNVQYHHENKLKTLYLYCNWHMRCEYDSYNKVQSW